MVTLLPMPANGNTPKSHGDDDMARLVEALQDVWQTLGLGLRQAAE